VRTLERPGVWASGAPGRRRHARRGDRVHRAGDYHAAIAADEQRYPRAHVGEIAAHGDLSRSYREIVESRLVQLADVVSRGIERGDLRPDTDVRLAHELLLGPVTYRLLYSGQPLDDGLAARAACSGPRRGPASTRATCVPGCRLGVSLRVR
jgi:Tetracyclin repressor-like, C-terminal domain